MKKITQEYKKIEGRKKIIIKKWRDYDRKKIMIKSLVTTK